MLKKWVHSSLRQALVGESKGPLGKMFKVTNAGGSINLAAEMAPEGGKWPHFSLAVGSKINKIEKIKKTERQQNYSRIPNCSKLNGLKKQHLSQLCSSSWLKRPMPWAQLWQNVLRRGLLWPSPSPSRGSGQSHREGFKKNRCPSLQSAKGHKVLTIWLISLDLSNISWKYFPENMQSWSLERVTNTGLPTPYWNFLCRTHAGRMEWKMKVSTEIAEGWMSEESRRRPKGRQGGGAGQRIATKSKPWTSHHLGPSTRVCPFLGGC